MIDTKQVQLVHDCWNEEIFFGIDLTWMEPMISLFLFTLPFPRPFSFVFCLSGIVVDTSGRLYDDFIRLVFFHTHRETSVLTNELSNESAQFRFLDPTTLDNLKGPVCWFHFGENIGHEDFYTFWSVILDVYHCLVSFVPDTRHLF